MRIKKGDKVQVLSGKDRGKQASVVRAMPAEGQVIVEGVHVAKRHAKPTRATMQGGVIDKFMPISASVGGHRVQLVRVPPASACAIDEQGRKIRVCRKCGADL